MGDFLVSKISGTNRCTYHPFRRQIECVPNIASYILSSFSYELPMKRTHLFKSKASVSTSTFITIVAFFMKWNDPAIIIMSETDQFKLWFSKA